MTDAPAPLSGWTPPAAPQPAPMEGRLVRLEPLTEAHAAELHTAYAGHDDLWHYLPYGPFPDLAAYTAWVAAGAAGSDPQFYALRDRATGRAAGVASYLRITPAAGSIELGHIALSPALQRSPAATEAWFLMMERAFALGYRRFEWKCNSANLPSRRAAERLGLSYEGVFRQHLVVKGRNRDSAWFAAIDREWPALRSAFTAWLSPDNFDADGRQRQRLSDLTRPLLAARDPALSH